MMEEALLASFSCLEPIYVDGVAGFLNLGDNFAQVYYRWQPVSAEGCGFRYEKVPAISIVRPKASILTCSNFCTFRDMLNIQPAPSRLTVADKAH